MQMPDRASDALDLTPVTPFDNSALSTKVYQQLHRIAANRIAAQPAGHTLQATGLVHEAYIKLQGSPESMGIEKAHFFRLAAEAMRQILIDHARSKGRLERGGGRRRMLSEVADLAAAEDSGQIMALEEAVQRFEKLDPRAAEVVKLRFFAGLSVEETADVMQISIRTVNREWKFARAWFFNALEQE
jgi:RNA polymerase sigma factor (TIGR02999 family)